jgi:hypothetical protein
MPAAKVPMENTLSEKISIIYSLKALGDQRDLRAGRLVK